MALSRIETDGINTDAITADKIASNAVTAVKINADAITAAKIASNAVTTTKINADAITAAKIADDVINSEHLVDGGIDNAHLATGISSSKLTGALPAISGAALTGVATDTSVMENNIAILAFKSATAGSLAKYNLVDQVIDEFVDSSGIDTGSSTNETLAGGYYSGSGTNMSVDFTLSASMLSRWHPKNGDYYSGGNPLSSMIDDGLTGGGFSVYSAPMVAGGWVKIDLGAGNEQAFTKWEQWNSGSGSAATSWKIQWSTNNSSWTDATGALAVPSSFPGSAIATSFTWSSVGAKRYWRMYQTSDQNSNSTGWNTEMRLFPSVTISNLTLQSAATAAEAVPTTCDMVMLMEDAAGTATLNTDVKGYVSRDGGSNWTQGTLTSEGGWGTNKKILVFRALSISSQPSGTSMKYKITTHNQVTAKQTRIHAVSLAWG